MIKPSLRRRKSVFKLQASMPHGREIVNETPRRRVSAVKKIHKKPENKKRNSWQRIRNNLAKANRMVPGTEQICNCSREAIWQKKSAFLFETKKGGQRSDFR
jgi:hypothetical protein